MSSILLLEAVYKQYQGNETPSLIDFNLQVTKGKTIAIMGESGSGKTTLLKLIAALEDPTKGQIYFQNQKLLGPKDKLVAGMPNIRLINQNLTLPPSQSIANSIGYQLKHRQTAYKDARTAELLDLFQLTEYADKLPSQLSGGQRQRALFAWAIADEPDLLLMDEPLSHLDDMFKAYLYDQVFKILKKSKTTVLFATHQASEVYRLADEVVLMKNGKTIQHGTPEAVYRQPKTVDAAKLMGECNVLPLRKFMKLLGHNINTISTKKIIIRPTAIAIATAETSTTLHGNIVKVTFMGGFYEVKVKLGKHALSTYRPLLTIHALENPLLKNGFIGVNIADDGWQEIL